MGKIINKDKYFCFLLLIVVFLYINNINIYGYTDTNLYEEKLVFSEDGTLIMSTHDKKATTNIKYQTIGWIIKRYDMPKDAVGQQYVIICADNEVEYRDDPNDSAYVYCYYFGNKNNIANSINKKSAEWKNILYKYGDYVYIDEIMTVVESGSKCGGLNNDGTAYGEVYYDYNGISNAREWAGKENLRTHFDKCVYFPQQVTEKKFGYTYTVLEKINKKNEPHYMLSLREGNMYKNTYNVDEGVPTGSDIYVSGYGENIAYNISFEKVNVNLRIPIKLVIRYKLKWKAYDGTVKTEIKDIVSWYHVNRDATYYIVDEVDVEYLSQVVIRNYAFTDGYLYKTISDCKPEIKKYHAAEYYNHVVSPVYKDSYYIDGGEIIQMEKKGIKPCIPDVNRQSVVETFVDECEVINDYLSINDKVILDNDFAQKEAYPPLNSSYSATKSIIISDVEIPHTKMNIQNNKSLGYLVYQNYYTNNSTQYNITGLKNISIHTPVCIFADVIKLNDGGFKINVDLSGNHNNIKGYGNNDYSDMCEKILIKSSKAIIKDGEVHPQDNWIEWNENDIYYFHSDEKSEVVYDADIEVVAIAKNYKSLYETWEKHIEKNANLDIENYGAYVSFNVDLYDIENENENTDINEVVGTH